MTIFEMHVEFAERPLKMFYGNANVVASDEQEAIRKFRELFRLDEEIPIRITRLKLSGILVV